MKWWKRTSPSDEERNFDQFLDELVRDPDRTRQAASGDLEQFAAWLYEPPRRPSPESLDADPILNHLRAVQRGYILSDRHTGGAAGGRPDDALPPSPVDLDNEYEYLPTGPSQGGWQGAGVMARKPIWGGFSYMLAGFAVVLTAAVIVSYMIGSSGGSGNDTDLRPPVLGQFKANRTPVASDSGPTPTVDPQTVATIEDVNITFLSWEMNSGIYTAFADEIPARDAFLVLEVTMVNTGTIPNKNAPFKTLVVKDEDGEIYEIDKYATVLANDAVDGESIANLVLEVGVEYVVYLVFDVPLDASSLTLLSPSGDFDLKIFGD